MQTTPSRRARRRIRLTHKQVTINLHGIPTHIDQGIRKLILMLNNIPRVETYHSCQGGRATCDEGVKYLYRPPSAYDAYVRVGGTGVFPLLPQLARAILREGRAWKRKHRHVCRGCHGMTIHLRINRNAIELRWQPWDYHLVLRIVAALAKASAIRSEKPART